MIFSFWPVKNVRLSKRMYLLNIVLFHLFLVFKKMLTFGFFWYVLRCISHVLSYLENSNLIMNFRAVFSELGGSSTCLCQSCCSMLSSISSSLVLKIILDNII